MSERLKDFLKDMKEEIRLLKELRKLQVLEDWKNGATCIIAMLLIETEEDAELFNFEPRELTPPQIVKWASELRHQLRRDYLPELKEKLADFYVSANTHPGYALSSLTPLSDPEVKLRKRRAAKYERYVREFQEKNNPADRSGIKS